MTCRSETLLAKYEEGARLVKICQEKLAEAELKIQQLEKTAAGEIKLKPLEADREREPPGGPMFCWTGVVVAVDNLLTNQTNL